MTIPTCTMITSNPSQILISRNPPRSPAHPQLAPASTSRHPHLGPWGPADDLSSTTKVLPAPSSAQDQYSDVERAQEEEEQVTIHATFARDATLPGRVKVVVGRHEFWCHREVLWFASPFFRGLLQGR